MPTLPRLAAALACGSALAIFPMPTGGGLREWLFRDLDGDGDLDLVLGESGRLRFFLNNGTARFSETPSHAGHHLLDDGLAAGDVDGDGDLDIVNIHLGGLELLRRAGLSHSTEPLVVAGLQSAIELADVDGDGDQDLIAATLNGNSSTFLRNDGAGSFTADPQLAGNLQYTTWIGAGDVDGDGDLDLVERTRTRQTIRLHLNDGAGVFTDVTATHLPVQDVPTTQMGTELIDVEDDGDLDVLMIRNEQLAVLINDGSGHFLDLTGSRWPPLGALGFSSGDLDVDGDIDVTLYPNGRFMFNHARHLVQRDLLQLGRTAAFDAFSCPNCAADSWVVLLVATAMSTSPTALPGVHGRLALHPAYVTVHAAHLVGHQGVTRFYLSVPAIHAMVGLDVALQDLVITAGATSLGLGNVECTTIVP